jgi:hypothetical protein
MNEKPHPRSLFGPLLMVAVGAVLLLVNLGALDARSAFVAFALYWPGLLILWGMSRLTEFWQARRAGLAAPGLGLGGVFMLVVLVFLGTAVTSAHQYSERVNWAGVKEEVLKDDDLAFLVGQRHEFTESIDRELPAGATVRVAADRGSVRVSPSTDGRVHLILRKTLFAYERAEAERVQARVVPTIDSTPHELVIDATRRAEWAGARLNLDIRVPPRAFLDISVQRGDVDVRGREAGVVIRVSQGDVTLEDIAGAAAVQLHHGDLSARNVRGDLVADGRIGDVVVARVDGAVELRGELYGRVRADGVSKGVRLKSTHTDVEIPRLDGDFAIADGALRVNGATGPVRVRTRSKDVDLEGIKGDVKVENRNGEIELEPHPQAPLGNIEVSSREGSVRLILPAAAAFRIDAFADKGGITSDFDLPGEKVGEGRARLSGVVNKGGAKVNIFAEHGSVRIRRR